jgi:hypothetical protein
MCCALTVRYLRRVAAACRLRGNDEHLVIRRLRRACRLMSVLPVEQDTQKLSLKRSKMQAMM